MGDGAAGRATRLGVELGQVTELWFAAGDPVRAASALAPLDDGWLVGQDDANHAAWWRPGTLTRLRLFEARDGLDVFSEAAGTKHLKPDVEAACAVEVGGRPGVLLLGSGSLPARTRAAVVTVQGDRVRSRAAELAPVYDAVADALDLPPGTLNLEGACRLGDRLRWFQRGHGRSGLRSASIDVDLASLLAVVHDEAHPGEVTLSDPRTYDLGTLGGLALTITDAIALPDGRVLVSAAAEDAPDAVADGPIAGSALALLDGEDVAVAPLPAGTPAWKVEGLTTVTAGPDGAVLLAVVDQDDPGVPSTALELTVAW